MRPPSTNLPPWALRRYAPNVAADQPDGLVLAVTGAGHRYGGDLRLLEALSETLEAQRLGASRLDLRFARIDNCTEAIRVGLARPVHYAARLTGLLCNKVETVDAGLGSQAMVLSAPIILPLDRSPSVGDLGGPEKPDIGDLVDLLAKRLDPQNLYRMAPAQSDVPERTIRKMLPTAPLVSEAFTRRWPRPPRLLARTEAIEAVAHLPDQPPVAFSRAAFVMASGALTVLSGSSASGGGATASVTRCGTISSWKTRLGRASGSIGATTATNLTPAISAVAVRAVRLMIGTRDDLHGLCQDMMSKLLSSGQTTFTLVRSLMRSLILRQRMGEDERVVTVFQKSGYAKPAPLSVFQMWRPS